MRNSYLALLLGIVAVSVWVMYRNGPLEPHNSANTAKLQPERILQQYAANKGISYRDSINLRARPNLSHVAAMSAHIAAPDFEDRLPRISTLTTFFNPAFQPLLHHENELEWLLTNVPLDSTRGFSTLRRMWMPLPMFNESGLRLIYATGNDWNDAFIDWVHWLPKADGTGGWLLAYNSDDRHDGTRPGIRGGYIWSVWTDSLAAGKLPRY